MVPIGLTIIPCTGTALKKKFHRDPGFYKAPALVTQALWQAVMSGDNERFLYKGDLQPAEHVSWNDSCRLAGS